MKYILYNNYNYMYIRLAYSITDGFPVSARWPCIGWLGFLTLIRLELATRTGELSPMNKTNNYYF